MRLLVDTHWAKAPHSGLVARGGLRRLLTAPRRSAALALAALAGLAMG